jgi:hypothetical protein
MLKRLFECNNYERKDILDVYGKELKLTIFNLNNNVYFPIISKLYYSSVVIFEYITRRMKHEIYN